MADKQHLEILKRGADLWNRWREEEFYTRPDLSDTDLHDIDITDAYLGEADLSNVNLAGKDLSNCDLNFAEMRGADLSGAKLVTTKLVGANLFRANLLDADIRGADLQAADIRDADLKRSKLNNANLSGAILNGANLSFADLNEVTFNATTLGDNDLREVIGLDSIVHLGPSVIGINTLYKSSGNIPEIFLRGCGVPEVFITYLRALTTEPIEFYSCFISYSIQDQEFASKLYHDLQQVGVRCWFAPEALRIGQRLRERIDESIRVYDKLLLILSEHSLRSDWVRVEAETALEVERAHDKTVLFPIRIDDEVFHVNEQWLPSVRERLIADFTGWKDEQSYQQSFSRLLRDLTLSGATEFKPTGSAR